jgi:hypothetical protein
VRDTAGWCKKSCWPGFSGVECSLGHGKPVRQVAACEDFRQAGVDGGQVVGKGLTIGLVTLIEDVET